MVDEFLDDRNMMHLFCVDVGVVYIEREHPENKRDHCGRNHLRVSEKLAFIFFLLEVFPHEGHIIDGVREGFPFFRDFLDLYFIEIYVVLKKLVIGIREDIEILYEIPRDFLFDLLNDVSFIREVRDDFLKKSALGREMAENGDFVDPCLFRNQFCGRFIISLLGKQSLRSFKNLFFCFQHTLTPFPWKCVLLH